EPAIERSEGSQRSGDRSFAEAALVEMGQEPADAHMVNVVPIRWADVGRKGGKVLAISSDGVCGGVPLLEGSEKPGDRELDDARLRHASFSHAGDAGGKRCANGRAPHAYRPA